MAHSKEHMLTTIAEMVTTMKAALEFAKVKGTHLILHERVSEMPADMIREGFNWLVFIFENQYLEYTKVRALLTDDQWARYLLWEDFEDFREVVLLRKATFEFRRAIVSRCRPVLFKKVKVNGKLREIDRKKKKDKKEAESEKATVKKGNARSSRLSRSNEPSTK